MRGGRFGKYGEFKRFERLRQSRDAKIAAGRGNQKKITVQQTKKASMIKKTNNKLETKNRDVLKIEEEIKRGE
jgi:hypothetical protein